MYIPISIIILVNLVSIDLKRIYTRSNTALLSITTMPSSMGEITAMANGSGMGGTGSSFPPQQHQHHLHQGTPYPSLLDRCAGCGAVDLSLLACDDLDGASGKNKDGLPLVVDPSQRARYVCVYCI